MLRRACGGRLLDCVRVRVAGWTTMLHPDPQGVTLGAVRRYLRDEAPSVDEVSYTRLPAKLLRGRRQG